jgi:hypothetical protein
VRKDKCRCSECRWIGFAQEIDKVKDQKSDDAWSVCPNCRTPEHILVCCDEEDCWEQLTCGSPTPDGYRSTCGKHQPK